jgi:hypothetical protein
MKAGMGSADHCGEETMTFPDLSLGSPVVRTAETATGEMGVVGARFIMAGGPSEGLSLDGLELSRPSLEEVYLEITGGEEGRG